MLKLFLYMKAIFLVLMAAILAFFPTGTKKLLKRKGVLSKKMFAVLIPATISVFAHCVVILTRNHLLASIFYSIYFATATWISVFVFDFCVLYADSKINRRIYKYFILPVAMLDSLSLIANIFFPFLFSLRDVAYGSEHFLRYSPTAYFLIHVVFGYGLFIYCFIIMAIKTSRETPSMRIKYYSLLTFLFLIAASNIIYILLDFPFNFSILIYAYCFIASYHVLFKVMPRRLILKTLGLIANGLKNGIVLLDMSGECIYINDFVKDFFGCTRQDVLKTDIIESFVKRRKAAGTEDKSVFSCELDYQKGDFRYILQVSDFFIRENDCDIGRYYLIEDITKTKNQVYEEKMLRTRDSLTGLFNKEYFFEKVDHRLKFDRFTHYYLLVTDIVNFKLINDLHGKAFGDTILMRIAESIRTHAAPDDIYGRLYNDHFVMFVPKRHFDEEAYVESFRSKMEYLNAFSYTLIGHIGVYEVDDLSLPVSVMCDRAFLALKSIKSDYKNTVAYYDNQLRLEVLKMQMLMNELPLALKYGQVVMYLQPQVKKNGELIGAEALVRWHHPTRGVIPPTEFIEIIEKINIISDVDRYVWECACKKLAEWKKNGREDLTISVNISARDFFTMDLYEIFTSLVKKYDISPKNLNLEITETAIIYDLENQMKLLNRLQKAGFVVEMDDFGSGYSSLNMLKDISVDVLKIDMGFLQKSKDDEKSRKILEKIIMLAKELGMEVVTEGIETDEQIGFLANAGCDFFQGFYFSRPIPVEDFEEKYLK